MESCEVVSGSVAEGGEAFVEVGGGHFVVKVEDVDGLLCYVGVAEWGLAGDGGGDDGEEDGGFACFGGGVEGDGSSGGDEGPCDPLFVVVLLGPEGVPVDDVGEVGGGVGWCGVGGEGLELVEWSACAEVF